MFARSSASGRISVAKPRTVELGREQRRGFSFAARRILGVDGDEPFEQADEAADIGLHAHSTFPRAATS